MRIVFIINTMGSGGAERVLATLAEEISKRYPMRILVFTSNEAFHSIGENVEVRYLSNAPNTFFGKLEQVFRFIRVLREEHTDLFISFLTKVNFVSLLFKPRSIPIIICERNAHYFLKSSFWRVIRRVLYPRADALTVQFPEDVVYYRKWLPNVEVMTNPCSLKGQVDVSEKENLAVVVSRLHHTKNVSMFFRAVSMLDDELRRSYRFCVLGEGNLKESLMQEAEALDVQVEFLGAVKNVEDYYKKAKIICLCSHVEGMPNVLIESLFFEVARISTKSSGGTISLIEDGVDGFLVGKDDAQAMSERMALLMRDENLRQRIVQQANKKRQVFDVKNITKQWINLIHKVKENRAGKKHRAG